MEKEKILGRSCKFKRKESGGEKLRKIGEWARDGENSKKGALKKN